MRRGIVEDTKLKELCENIWKNPKYKEALLILNEYQPDVSDLITEIRKNLEENGIDIYDYRINTNTDFAVFTKNYKKRYPNWKEYCYEDLDIELDIRFGFYIVKSNIQFWLRLSDNPSESSLKYFNRIKAKLKKPRSKKWIVIRAEDRVEDFDRFDIENTKEKTIEEFFKILQIVDGCFKENMN